MSKDILHFGLTGERPKWKNHPRPGTRRGQVPLYIQIAPDVARWRDEEQLSWPRIIAHLAQQGVSVSENTVRRAYDRAHPEIARAAAASGQTPKRGRYSHISPGTKQRIRELLGEGKMTLTEIARLAGCSVQTVERQKGAAQAANPM